VNHIIYLAEVKHDKQPAAVEVCKCFEPLVAPRKRWTANQRRASSLCEKFRERLKLYYLSCLALPLFPSSFAIQ